MNSADKDTGDRVVRRFDGAAWLPASAEPARLWTLPEAIADAIAGHHTRALPDCRCAGVSELGSLQIPVALPL